MYQTPNIYGYFFERQILCDSETCHTGRLAAALCFMLIKTRAAGMRLPRVPRLSTLRLCERQLFAVRLTCPSASLETFPSAPSSLLLTEQRQQQKRHSWNVLAELG